MSTHVSQIPHYSVCGFFRKRGKIRKVYRLFRSIRRGKRFRLIGHGSSFRERHPMKLQRLLCLSSVLLITTIGCCHSQCVSSNPCDPCGRGMSGGCCLTNWFHSKLSCQNYSWANECSSCGCSVCGGDSCGVSGAPTFAGGSGSSCGCGQSHGTNYAPAVSSPSVPTSVDPNHSDAPTPVPNQTSPMPRGTEPNPAPPSTTFQPPVSGQIQHVTMEEFQRLPGVVVSGPTSSVPTMAQPTLAPPTLSNVSVPPRPAHPVQQAQWVPAK
jgi:hypothetical protein